MTGFPFRAVLALALVVVMAGCQWWQQEEEAEEDPAVLKHQADVGRAVARGDLAFTKDCLTSPAHDNAVMHYRQALALEPGNAQAQAGLDRVVRRLLDLAKVSHGNGRIRQADSYLEQAEQIGGKTRQTRDMRARLNETPAGRNARALVPVGMTSDYRLSREALQARSPEIERQLQDIARRAKASNRKIVVTARNAEEGQWVEKTLKDATPRFPLPVEVRLGEKPGISLEPVAPTTRQGKPKRK